ncbi:MAG: hypothetical protein ACXIT9_05820 [Nitritalea sp.]
MIMKCFGALILFLFSLEALSQVIIVVDENNKPLPFYTLSIGDNNNIQIGDKDGKTIISREENHCNYVIRYLGYETKFFCLSDLKNDENVIQLKSEFIDLPESEIKSYSDEELITRSKIQLSEMTDKFNLARSYLRESSKDYLWESFGVVTLAGLQDRNNKKTQFNHGGMGFLAQYSSLWTSCKELVPFQSNMGLVSTFIQDLFLSIINTKNSKWKLSDHIENNEEVFELKDLNTRVQLNSDGSIKKLIILNQPFAKYKIGKESNLTGEISFIMDKENYFISQLEFDIHDESNNSKLYCKVLDYPREIKLPERYSNKRNLNALLNNLGNFTSSPNYLYDESKFLKLKEGIDYKNKSEVTKGLSFVSDSYLFHEIHKTDDSSSLSYLQQNSNFILELLKILKSYELAW